MTIFITSSWINKYAVEMLALILQQDGHTVLSFLADNDNEISLIGQTKDIYSQSVDYAEWVYTPEGEDVFNLDIANIKKCEAMIVIEPAGRDSWAHVGIAHALAKKIYGLNSKGRKVGLMRRLVTWSKDISWLRRLLTEKAR